MDSRVDIYNNSPVREALKAFLVGFFITALSFLVQGDILFGLADEGFLWYGSWRTALGEVPIRDFNAYDPGRYYWNAGWSMLFGDNIMALRKSVAVFQAIGLSLGLLALRRVVRSWWLLAGLGLLLTLWMFPRHKVFEQSISLAAVYFATLLIERPSMARHLVAGIFVGLAAFFGRNHGLYLSVSFFLLILFLWFKTQRSDLFKRAFAWGAGVIAGYSPMLFMSALIPGFFDSVVESILFLFHIKATNIPLPVPWPWTMDPGMPGAATHISIGLLFMMMPLFYAWGAVYLIRDKGEDPGQNALLAASVFVGAAYMHPAFSRADISHLAQGIQPLLIGLIALPFILKNVYIKRACAGIIVLVLVLSCFSVARVSPYFRKALAPCGTFEHIDINGDDVLVHRHTARLIRDVKEIYSEKVGPGEGLLIAPHWPGFYPILKIRSPLWETYFLFEEIRDKQEDMIVRLKKNNVKWVILGDVALDGREDLRFKNTHRLLWRYINEAFEAVDVDGLPGNYRLMVTSQKVRVKSLQ